jgi:hypothetical protein
MGKANFPMPDDLTETVSLLNATGWNLSLLEQSDSIRIYSGDQLMFTAFSTEEAEVFLAGCFLSTFSGRNLQEIRDEVKKGNFVIETDWLDIMKKRLGPAQD